MNMKNKTYYPVGKIYRFGFIMLVALSLSSCAGYQSVYNMETDGIYAANNRNRPLTRTAQSTSSQTVAATQQPQQQVRQQAQTSEFNNNFFANELQKMEEAPEEDVATDAYYNQQDAFEPENQRQTSWGDQNRDVIVNVNPGFGYQNAFFNHFNTPLWGFNTFYGDPWLNQWGLGFNTWNVGFNRWNGFNRWHVGFNNFGWGWNRPLWNNYYGYYRRPFVNRNQFARQRAINRRGRTVNRRTYRNRPRASASSRIYRRSSGVNNRRNFSREQNVNTSRRATNQNRRNIRSSSNSKINSQRSRNQTRKVERARGGSARSQRSIKRSNTPRSSNRSYRKSSGERSSNRSYRSRGGGGDR